MDNILLIIYDYNLRQLYHELLLTKNIEIVPTDSIENAILLLTLTTVSYIIIYSDARNSKEIDSFLTLRATYGKWKTVPLILLSLEIPNYHTQLTGTDTIIIIEQLTPEAVSDKIKAIVNHTS